MFLIYAYRIFISELGGIRLQSMLVQNDDAKPHFADAIIELLVQKFGVLVDYRNGTP